LEVIGTGFPFTHNFALNEVALQKTDSSHFLTIETHIDGEFLSTFWADGILVMGAI
jgi:NAD+ kinase